MGIFNPESKFMQAMEGIFYLIVLGLLWLVLSMTVIGIGPASTALYYAVTKSVRKGRGTPFQEFFSSLKANWLPSLIIGILLTAFAASIYFFDWNYIILLITTGQVKNTIMTVLAFVKIFLLLGIANFVFPILSRFNIKVPKAVLFSLAFTFRHFGVTLCGGALLLLTVYLAVLAPAISWLFPGAVVWLLSLMMEPVLRKYTPESDDAHTDQWYLEK